MARQRTDPFIDLMPLLIGVDGHGGSGKSTLATWLGDTLDAQIIYTDDFASWENPYHWWHDLRRLVLVPLREGASTLNYPRSSWAADHHPEPVAEQPVTPIMILEGVSSLRREFREFLSYGIFVDTPPELCLERGFQRDQCVDGKPDDEVRQMWADWQASELTLFADHSPRECADVVVDGTRPWEAQLDVDTLRTLTRIAP